MTVLITGANRGIGRALHDHYSDAGVDVIGTCRDEMPTTGRWISLDVTEPNDVSALRGAMDDAPLDLLVCNAGVYPDKSADLNNGYPADMWADAFAVNVTGVFLTIQALLPNLALAVSPKIAIIPSQMASHTLAPGDSYIYRASKAAVLNVGRNLAVDLKPKGIAVGIYHPGWVQTDMGGTQASITMSQSADGLVNRFAARSLATTGCFETWDGRALPF